MPIATDDVTDQPIRVQLETFLDTHRGMLAGCLDATATDAGPYDVATTGSQRRTRASDRVLASTC